MRRALRSPVQSSRIVAALSLAALLAACSTTPKGPDYQVPANAVSQRPQAQAAFMEQQRAASEPGGAPYVAEPLPAHWWRLFHDEQLDGLVQKALVHNTDLRQAAAHLEQVQAMEAEVFGAEKPSVSMNAAPYFGHPSGTSMLKKDYVPPDTFRYSGSIGVSYQLDLFGQIRRAVESSQASTEAAVAALDLVKVNVAASTARAYADACATGQRLETARHSVELQRQALDLTERLQHAGRVGEMDAARARSQLEQLQAALPPLLAQRQSALYRLATLTGDLPEQFPQALAECHTPPQLTGTIPVGDGAALLKRRPDIRQAERELHAATARIGVAMADRYPKISLGLSAGSGPSTLARFGRSESLSFSLGPLISWTLPNNGVANARIAQAEASTRQSAARFDGVVLNALRETETALNQYARELDRRAALQRSREAAAVVADQARRLYQAGKVGYLDALDAERALAASDATLAASEATLVEEQVQLFLALGGGWERDENNAVERPVRQSAR
ncbi:efflux transporter outer membrane subunit [Roseateles terrae]|uniref:NodT family efflux transporter outer membrane factor (OMF) lipoprotein n=1 Tax=Roseateles terrae TaxID=431060 RepID=A0ABR6H0H7_9BURK|nr:TolC family protein [Roseateles terrae]MBB3197338.1 NodT family efflux transporter outer membrane factor (OMF) lipoprotein [Roseateles terrae]OWQ83184.1 RND transporter [Roseateles terrae]